MQSALSECVTLRLSFLVAAAMVGGCQGNPVVLSASGPQQAETSGASEINTFTAAFDLAYKTVPQKVAGAAAAATVSGDAAIAANNEYLSSGLALVDVNCSDYFHRQGNLQQAVNVYRDLANAFLPIVAGGLALGAQSAKAGSIVALAQAASNGVLSTIYTDFLFDASNIDDVQKLVSDALSAHETAVRANLAAAPDKINFHWVSMQIIDHQAICQPAHILGLARQAIGNGTIIARNLGTPGQQQQEQPAGTPGALAPSVGVSVAPAGSATVSQTFIYRPDLSTRDLMQCLYPGATFDAHGAPVDAAGKPAIVEPKALGRLKDWMTANNVQDGIAVFTRTGDPKLRAAAAKKVCQN